MNPDHLVGIDIGTQGTKAVLVDIRGRLRGSAFCKSRLHRPAPGAVEEDPEYQFRAVCRCIRDCVEAARIDPARLAAIGIDGQMAGILGIGADGRNVTPYDSWLDTRCSAEIAMMRSAAGEEIIRKTGGPPSFNHGPKILWWKGRHPEVYRRIAAFVQPGGYAAMRLCELPAAEAFVDTSYLHFSGFADNVRGRWDAGISASRRASCRGSSSRTPLSGGSRPGWRRAAGSRPVRPWWRAAATRPPRFLPAAQRGKA
jgi:xylulokinase